MNPLNLYVFFITAPLLILAAAWFARSRLHAGNVVIEIELQERAKRRRDALSARMKDSDPTPRATGTL